MKTRKQETMESRNNVMLDTLTGVVIDPENHIAAKCTIERTREGYMKLFGYDTINSDKRRIGNQRFEVVFDGCGGYHAGGKDVPVSAIDIDKKPAMLGKLFVLNWDKANRCVDSLNDEEIGKVLSNIVAMDDNSMVLQLSERL